jgi:hypothetical protein
MIAILLSALFLGSGLLAVATMISSWRRHGAAVRALRAELRACEPLRNAYVRMREVTVRSTATVLPLKPAGNPATRPLRPAIAAA